MSLRAFHVIFISASWLLCVLVFAWSLATRTSWMAVAAGLVAVGLLAYGVSFVLRRLHRQDLRAPELSGQELGS